MNKFHLVDFKYKKEAQHGITQVKYLTCSTAVNVIINF